MTKSKPKGKQYKVLRDGYHPKGVAPKVGAKITLDSKTAAKLLHRGIIEEVT